MERIDIQLRNQYLRVLGERKLKATVARQKEVNRLVDLTETKVGGVLF